MGATYDRQKRVQRLKKIILGLIIGAILVPLVLSIVLGIRVVRLGNRVKELEGLLEEAESREGRSVYSVSPIEESPRDERTGRKSLEEADKTGSADEDVTAQKEIYLTFDDGPSGNTSKILDILKEYGVKATFFVVGKTDDNSVALYKRIVEEGHTLAMHSYSHKYDEIYKSEESFVEDMEMLQEYLYDSTGIWPRYYRFPGGSSNTVSKVDMQKLMVYLNENGITYFDWNISSGDASSIQISSANIVENCMNGMKDKEECMILMHDANEKKTTVEALPEVIRRIQERGDSVFLPITDDTPPVQHITLQ